MTAPAPYPVVAVAGIVFDDAGRVLLVERGRPPGVGLWTVPGGRVEHGEALTAAVAREVAEETGLAVEVGALLEVVERVIPAAVGAYHYVILDYLAVARAPGPPRAGDDARAARFIAVDELDRLPLTDGLRPVIERARAAWRSMPSAVAKPLDPR